MDNVKERLDQIKDLIQQTDFLEGKGLSNEVNIRIFCYNPKEEMTIRHFIKQIEHEDLNCHLIHHDLYEVFLIYVKIKEFFHVYLI